MNGILATSSPSLHSLPHIPTKIWFFAAVAIIGFLAWKFAGHHLWILIEGVLMGILLVGFFPQLDTFVSQDVTATLVTSTGRARTATVAGIVIAGMVIFAIVMTVREQRRGGE